VRDLHPQDAGLGHVTHLTRIEWSFVRTLIGRPRRLSAAFLAAERAKLAAYRHEVRTLRQLQLTGAATSGLELDVSANGSMQSARSPSLAGGSPAPPSRSRALRPPHV
jgi:hypothetical protein